MRRLVALILLLLLAWPDPTRSVVADMYQDGSNAKLPEARTNLGIRSFSPVKDHGADPIGVADATAAIQAAQADCAAAGGGVIDITGARLLIGSGNITVAAGCPIQGEWVPRPIQTTYKTSVSALVHGAGQTLTVGAGASLRNVLVVSADLPAVPATPKQGSALVKAMAGTGITLGTGTVLENVQSAGFATAFGSTGASQIRMKNVIGDGTSCLAVISAHDQVNIQGLECWPFLTASQSWTLSSSLIAGAANNGAGKIRVTVASTANFTTGDTLFVYGAGGFVGANTPCVNATVINATQFDCPGLSSAPVATAAVVSGSNVITLAVPDPSIHGGQTVTDTTTGGNIPPATTVTFVSGTKVYLSNTATGSGASDTITFANAAYTGGGTVTLYNDYRSGTAIYGNDNTLLQCDQCYVYGYAIALDLNKDVTDSFTGFAVDNNPALNDPTSIGIRIRGVSYGNIISGPYIVAGQPIVGESTAPIPNNLQIARLYQIQNAQTVPSISLISGSYQINNSAIQVVRGKHIYVDSGVTMAQFCGDDFTGATFYWQNDTTYLTKLFICPGVLYGTGPLVAKRETWQFSTNGNLTAGSTIYASHGLGFSTVEANAAAQVSQQGTFSKLGCTNSAPPGAGQSHTITVRTPMVGSDSPLVCTIADAGRNCLDQTHTTPAVGGGRQAIQLVASAGAAAANLNCAVTVSSP